MQRLLTDESGVTHSISIPPPLIRKADRRDARRGRAAGRAAVPRVARLMHEPVLQPIYDLELPRMAFGRIAIVGDAAFVARPHVGAGVPKASDDVMRWCRRSPRTMWSRRCAASRPQRLPIGRRVIERARHLGAYLQATQTEEERAHAGRYSTAQAVIEETALVDFLYRALRRAAQHEVSAAIRDRYDTACGRSRIAAGATLHASGTQAYSPSSFFALPPQIAAVVAASNPVDTTCSTGSKSAMSNG